MPLIRSISGIRGTTTDALTPEVVKLYTLGFESLTQNGKIVIGADGRKGFEHIYEVVKNTLIECGREVVSCGIVPTPTMQILVEKLGSAGGIVVTASHNPSEWNGLKFIASDGIFLRSKDLDKLWQFVDKPLFTKKTQTGFLVDFHNFFHLHFDKIFNISFLQQKDILKRIKQRKFKVVFDGINSSGSKIIPELLEKLGCEVVKVNCENNGIFVHNPEPKPEHLVEVKNIVKMVKADIGFAVDPDADRLVVIDENGNALWEELTIVLSFLSVAKLIDNFDTKFFKKVVVNYSTTSLIETLSNMFGFDVHRSPVGEVNVVERMISTNAIIGGEGSGGVILSESHYGRDSLVGIVLILALLTVDNCKVSELVNSLPKLQMKKSKVRLEKDFETKLSKILQSMDDIVEYNREDGLWINTAKGWMHIRRSNTEPFARIIYESGDSQFIFNVEKLIKRFFEVLNNE